MTRSWWAFVAVSAAVVVLGVSAAGFGSGKAKGHLWTSP